MALEAAASTVTRLFDENGFEVNTMQSDAGMGLVSFQCRLEHDVACTVKVLEIQPYGQTIAAHIDMLGTTLSCCCAKGGPLAAAVQDQILDPLLAVRSHVEELRALVRSLPLQKHASAILFHIVLETFRIQGWRQQHKNGTERHGPDTATLLDPVAQTQHRLVGLQTGNMYAVLLSNERHQEQVFLPLSSADAVRVKNTCVSIYCRTLELIKRFFSPFRSVQGIQSLPPGLLLHLLGFLQAKELESVSQCSSGFHTLARSNALWQRLCRHDFGSLYTPNNARNEYIGRQARHPKRRIPFGISRIL